VYIVRSDNDGVAATSIVSKQEKLNTNLILSPKMKDAWGLREHCYCCRSGARADGRRGMGEREWVRRESRVQEQRPAEADALCSVSRLFRQIMRRGWVVSEFSRLS
jgi:hypothetical protein